MYTQHLLLSFAVCFPVMCSIQQTKPHRGCQQAAESKWAILFRIIIIVWNYPCLEFVIFDAFHLCRCWPGKWCLLSSQPVMSLWVHSVCYMAWDGCLVPGTMDAVSHIGHNGCGLSYLAQLVRSLPDVSQVLCLHIWVSQILVLFTTWTFNILMNFLGYGINMSGMG